MLLATIGPMMGAPLAHFFSQARALPVRPPFFVASMAAMLFASVISDRLARSRAHPASLRGAVVLFVWGNLRALVIGPSETWHRLAEWLLR
jgi:hypothetical protein